MASNNSITLVNLDFDTLKSSLKAYLSNQSQFSDYNFEGSNISTLLDILSYNSYLNAFYLNMVVSESFLDSAQTLSSIVSKAKELNYIPRSYKSSKATVNLQVAQQPSISAYTLPKGTKFTAVNTKGTFTFTTNSSFVAYLSNGYYSFNSLPLFEGIYFTDTFTADNTIEAQKFVMTNSNIDTDSLSVTVIENLGQTTTVFNRANSLYGLDSTSNAYFLQAASDGNYEIVFGDGIFGRTPLNGSVILANYRLTAGSDGNEASNFNVSDNVGSFIIQTISAASGGANAETIESIRFNAPRHFQTQERAITTNDYKALVLSNFTDVKACHVFGGETVSNTISFGTVYVSPVTYSGATTSLSEKASIESFLAERCTMGIQPKVIDPDFLYLQVKSLVKFDPNSTVNSASDISQIVSAAIQNFNANNLEDFNTTFRYSKFEQAINDSDPSIFSNQTQVSMKKMATPSLNEASYISVEYRNPIKPSTIKSSSFLSGGSLYYFSDYNPNNNTFSIMQTQTDSIVTNSSNQLYIVDITNPQYPSYIPYGTIDYAAGSINVNQITINDFYGSAGVVFYALPVNQDVTSYNNDVIEIDIAEGVDITVVSV